MLISTADQNATESGALGSLDTLCLDAARINRQAVLKWREIEVAPDWTKIGEVRSASCQVGHTASASRCIVQREAECGGNDSNSEGDLENCHIPTF